jgi:hypothetical protein
MPAAYRIEWRCLVFLAGEEFCDSRFETAVAATDIRAFGLSVGIGALGGEFIVTAPDGCAVHASLDGLRTWTCQQGSLPPPYDGSIWKAEHNLAVEADLVITPVRRALMAGVDRGVLTMRHAFLLLAALRSVLRRVVG